MNKRSATRKSIIMAGVLSPSTMFAWMLLCCVAWSRATGSKVGVRGVVGHSAQIPCEITPSSPDDAPYLILWYKEVFGTPIYRY